MEVRVLLFSKMRILRLECFPQFLWFQIVGKFGADALRLYLINSPVVRAENLRFKEEGVRDILKDVFLPWYNAYRFLVQNVLVLNTVIRLFFTYNVCVTAFIILSIASVQARNTPIKFRGDESSPNIMDRWILSFTQSLLLFVRREMTAYRLYTVVPRLIKFIDNLTNWYVRMNRKRFKVSPTRVLVIREPFFLLLIRKFLSRVKPVLKTVCTR